jgi:hypothetical protein
VLARGRLDVAGWFMWPWFLASDRDDPIQVNTFEMGFGLNGRID